MLQVACLTPRAILPSHANNRYDASLEGSVFPALFTNFFPVHTRPDGHCGFHAVSRVLFNDENHHFILRLLSCLVIQENWDFFEAMIHSFSTLFSVDAVLHHTATTAETAPHQSWYDNIHAKALSMALRREFLVFVAFDDYQHAFVGRDFTEVQQVRHIVVSHCS